MVEDGNFQTGDGKGARTRGGECGIRKDFFIFLYTELSRDFFF